jgi:hypothetical protein
MVKYLSMDGVDDNLAITTNISFNEVVIDFIPKQKTSGWSYILDGRYGTMSAGYFAFNSQTTISKGENWGSYYNNGVLNQVPTKGTRTTLKIMTGSNAVFTSKMRIFSISSGGMDFLSADVFNIKFLNNGVVIAHYDMSTGTVQDQSGNGNHATLTGGTWMDDGTGGGTIPTIHEGESILSSVSNLTADLSLIYNGESTLSATSNLTAEASVIHSADVILSAVSNLTAEGDKISQEVSADLSVSANLTAIGSIIVNGETVLSANSELTAIGEIISMDISVDLSASASLTVEGSVIHSAEASLSAVSQLEALASLIVSGEVKLSATSQLTVLPEKDLVGVIRLKGKREIYVYLRGKREIEVHLKGGLNVTVVNENFTMEAGDNKELVFDVGESFAGSQELSWELYNKRSDIEPFIKISGYAQDNEVRVPLIPSDTKAYLGRSIFYELIVIDPLQKKSTLTKGMVTFE